jgi:hypothetical protein
MKIRIVRANGKIKALSAREVDELINRAILKPVAQEKKTTQKKVFINWELPVEPIGYLRCKKYDPL